MFWRRTKPHVDPVDVTEASATTDTHLVSTPGAGKTIQIGLVSAANIASMLVVQWLVLTRLGPGSESDALFAAMTIPQIFASIVSASITQALAPLLAGEPAEDQRLDGWTLVSLCSLLFGAAALLLALTAPWTAEWIFPGFDPTARRLTVYFTQISAIGIVFTGLNAIQMAIAFAQNRYMWTDAAPMISSLVAAVAMLVLLPLYGALAAAWIMVGRLVLLSLLLGRGMGRPLRPDLSRPTVHILWKRLKPMILGSSYYKMDPLVDRFLLSSLTPGSLSIVYLVQQLHSAGSQVVTKALAIPALTSLATAHKQGDSAHYSLVLRRTGIAMLWVCGAGVLAMVLCRPLIPIVMVHGAFTHADAHLLWVMLLLTSGMFVAATLGNLISGTFYAVGDTRTPTLLGTFTFTVSIGVKALAFMMFGLVGLALAISFYYLGSLVLTTVVLRRRGLL